MAKLNPMVSMKRDEESIFDAMPMTSPLVAKETFPYGLQITLTHDEMEKLELDPADAKVGGMIHLHALARITSISQNDMGGKKCCEVRLQIEDMCVESEDRENEEEDDEAMEGRRMSRLYDHDRDE